MSSPKVSTFWSNIKGFTLVELLVVMVILAILGVVGITMFNGVSKNASDAKKKADIIAISKAYETNYTPSTGYSQLSASQFATGAIPTPTAGGNYYIDLVANGGFRVCSAVNGGTDPCSANSGTCFCKDSVQVNYVSGGYPTPPYTTPYTTPPAPFDYSLANGGNKSVTQGSNVTNSIDATLVAGTSEPVSFSTSGLPSGAGASYAPTSCNPTCSTTMTITTSGSTPTGNSTITVTGTPLAKTSSFTLTVNAPATQTFIASTGFSSTQGANQWRYQEAAIGSFTYNDLTWDGPNSRWGYDWSAVYSNQQHPNPTLDSVRTWVAPSSGTATITNNGDANIITPGGCGDDGTVASVYKNNSSSPLWTANIPKDATGVPMLTLTPTVIAGDQIHFRVNKGSGNNWCDMTTWDPKIVL